MAEPVSPKGPIHISIKRQDKGSSKLVVSSEGEQKEVECKVILPGMVGSVKAAFLNLTGWACIKYENSGSVIDVFVKQSDLDDLQKQGLSVEVEKTTQCYGKVFAGHESLTQTIESFFPSDADNGEFFLMRVQEFSQGDRKKLVLDNLFQEEKCPDIFSDPLFSALEDLSLKGIQDLPRSIENLTSLKKLDLSYSSMIDLPDFIKKLTNLESLSLSFSKLTEKKFIIAQGKEYLGGKKTRPDHEYEEVGAERIAKNLHEKLGPLKNLKQLYISSQDDLIKNYLYNKMGDVVQRESR